MQLSNRPSDEMYQAQEAMRQQSLFLQSIYVPFVMDKLQVAVDDIDSVFADYAQRARPSFTAHFMGMQPSEASHLLSDRAVSPDSREATLAVRSAYNRGLHVLYQRYKQEVASGEKEHLSYIQFVKSIQPWYADKFAYIVARQNAATIDERVA